MTRPSWLVRLAGSPAGSVLVILFCGCIIAGWWEGLIRGWVAFAAAWIILQTISARKQVRRYNAWVGEWREMGGESVPAARKRSTAKLWGGAVVLVAVLLAIGRLFPKQPQQGEAFAVVWCPAFAALLASRLIPLLRRRSGKRAAVKQAKAETEPVAWVVGRASSSPSRAEAEKNLPEYAARVLNGQPHAEGEVV